jgi:hypothetical protein
VNTTTTSDSSNLQVAGFPLEVFIGIVCGGLVTLIICINGIIFCKFCYHRDNNDRNKKSKTRKRGEDAVVAAAAAADDDDDSSSADDDSAADDDSSEETDSTYGYKGRKRKRPTAVVATMDDGRVVFKKITPLRDGTSIVKKMVFPNKETAARALSKRYRYDDDDDNSEEP